MAAIHFIAGHCTAREIRGPGGELYLTRYRLFGWLPGDPPKPLSLYLHRFHREDDDRELHNHPWTFAVSFILAGGYHEELVGSIEPPLGSCLWPHRRLAITKRTVERKPGRINFLRGDTFHRVSEIPKAPGRETWTLFLAGPKASGWGFLTDRGTVPWREFLASKGVTPDY